jgi:hypothetical protein
MLESHPSRVPIVFFITLVLASSCLAQLPEPQASPAKQPANNGAQPAGSISGTVIDPTGAVIAGAQVTLSVNGQPIQKTKSGNQGEFSFSNVPAGPFQLTIDATGFEPQKFSEALEPGQSDNLLPIMLSIGQAITSVDVGVPQVEVAQEQLKVEEQQRVLGIVPNFYVSYIPNAAPLDGKQKFQLALRTVVDPVTFLFVGAVAGVQQEQGHFKAYGTGPGGYARRYGANYGDTVSGTFLGGALFPWLLRQDPRYFYKGTGSFGSRMYYAISRAVITKGDNQRWQANYSAVLGDLASGAISNLYYPADDRHGAALTFENAAIGVASGAAANIFQEFVVPKFMPKHKKKQNQP